MKLPYEKIAVLGAGAFGVALSKITASKTNHVVLWSRDPEVCQKINSHHHHPDKLSSILLPNNVEAVLDLAYALKDASIVILTLPLEALAQVLGMARAFIKNDALLISTSKGIAPKSLFLPHDIIAHAVPKAIAERASYLSGPSFAIELAEGLPTAMTIASALPQYAQELQKNFSTPNCRLYYSCDVVGVLVGGALKNVIAIAAGVGFELRLGKNAQASLITRGLAEIARLAKKMGGQTQTLMGLSGVGDLVLSATDPMSRNFKLGMLLAQGYSRDSSLKEIGGVVEGANTAQAVPELMKHHNVDLPICHAVYQVLYEALPPLEALKLLLNREPKDEFI